MTTGVENYIMQCRVEFRAVNLFRATKWNLAASSLLLGLDSATCAPCNWKYGKQKNWDGTTIGSPSDCKFWHFFKFRSFGPAPLAHLLSVFCLFCPPLFSRAFCVLQSVIFIGTALFLQPSARLRTKKFHSQTFFHSLGKNDSTSVFSTFQCVAHSIHDIYGQATIIRPTGSENKKSELAIFRALIM